MRMRYRGFSALSWGLPPLSPRDILKMRKASFQGEGGGPKISTERQKIWETVSCQVISAPRTPPRICTFSTENVHAPKRLLGPDLGSLPLSGLMTLEALRILEMRKAFFQGEGSKISMERQRI